MPRKTGTPGVEDTGLDQRLQPRNCKICPFSPVRHNDVTKSESRRWIIHFTLCERTPVSGGGAEGGRFGGLLHDSVDKLQGFGGLGRAGRFLMSRLHQAFLNRVESQARTLQNDEKIFLGDGT